MYFDVLHWLVEEMCEVEQNTSLEKELSSIYFRQSLNKTWSPPEANSFPGFYSAGFFLFYEQKKFLLYSVFKSNLPPATLTWLV